MALKVQYVVDRMVNVETHQTRDGERVRIQTRDSNGRFSGSRVDVTDEVVDLLSR